MCITKQNVLCPLQGEISFPWNYCYSTFPIKLGAKVQLVPGILDCGKHIWFLFLKIKYFWKKFTRNEMMTDTQEKTKNSLDTTRGRISRQGNMSEERECRELRTRGYESDVRDRKRTAPSWHLRGLPERFQGQGSTEHEQMPSVLQCYRLTLTLRLRSTSSPSPDKWNWTKPLNITHCIKTTQCQWQECLSFLQKLLLQFVDFAFVCMFMGICEP